MALIIMAMITTASSAQNLQAKLGLPLRNQVIGWVVLVVSATLPFLHLPMHRTISSRVLTYFLGFDSSSDGGKEGQTKPGGYRFQLDDLRIALFFLFFVQVGFFGTGK